MILLPHSNQFTTVTMYLNNKLKPVELSLNNDKLQYHTNQHMYVVSSKEELKNGDWCIEIGLLESTLIQFNGNSDGKCFKIIKTTNDALGLPAIPKLLLEAYVNVYNRDNFSYEVNKKFLTKVKSLTTEEQIDILTRAKIRIENKLNSGVCLAVDDSLIDSGRQMVYHINTVIPLFTKANAYIACSEKKTQMPDLGNSFWWDSENIESRIAFLDWMIEQLQSGVKK